MTMLVCILLRCPCKKPVNGCRNLTRLLDDELAE